MRWRRKIVMGLGGFGVLLTACGVPQEARKEDRAFEDFQAALAQRQIERRREIMGRCHQRGVVLPEDYLQKGGGMLEEYVPDRPPCGMTARERTGRAEADFRVVWGRMMGRSVPIGYEWLLMVKRRIAELVDEGVITAGQARRVLREAQFILADRDRRGEGSLVAGQTEERGGDAAKILADLNGALNEAVAGEGIPRF